MKVILTEFIKTLGEPGQEVNVAPGYARNFLIPRKLAMEATVGNSRTFANNQQQRSRKIARAIQDAENLKATLEALEPLTFLRKAGEDGKLFGSVTNADVQEALKARGFEVDKKKIEMDHHIKQAGDSEVVVRLQSRITAMVKVSVRPDVVEEAKPEEDETVAENQARSGGAETDD